MKFRATSSKHHVGNRTQPAEVSQTLQRDYNGFVNAGGDIRHAKDHHNVIQPYFLRSLLTR